MSKKLFAVLGLLVVVSMLLVACGGTEAPATEPTQETAAEPTEAPADTGETPTEEPVAEPTEEPMPPTTRVGGWLDTISLSTVSSDAVVTQLEAGAADLYANQLVSPQDVTAMKEAGLESCNVFGLYYEITFNPYGPTFDATGALNPFSSAKVREAMNWLIDRDYINEEVYGGNAHPKFVSLLSAFPEYARYIATIREYEVKYAANRDKAVAGITAGMEEMGAEMVDGKWNYNGAPVEITFLIRTDSDGTRRPMGDIISNWLEEVGFTVNRQYGTSSELSALWVQGDVADGDWNLYTGAWISNIVSRDDTGDAQFFYAPSSAYSFTTLWQAYTMDEADQKILDDLANKAYATPAERDELFRQAFDVQFKYNYRVWVEDGRGAATWVPGVQVSCDLAAGLDANPMWGYTARFADQEGGVLRVIDSDLFTDPANAIAGSNWTYDSLWQGPTSSGDLFTNPSTGISIPQRLESATVTVRSDLPVKSTYDWVTLETADEITVPGDMWVDWDPETETFITVDEKFPDGLTAATKTVYYYPADMFDVVSWHDGSQLSVGDFLMKMIMFFATGTEGSPIFDESQAGTLAANLDAFKGFKITSTDPLVIESYSDVWYEDAELIVGFRVPNWPEYGYGEASWEAIAIGNKAEIAGELAYTADKASALEVEQTNYLAGPSLDILSAKLDEAAAETYIPFEPTMGQYVTAEEAAARYANLQAFYADHGHFWSGTGPYILDQIFPVEKTATLTHNPNFPDLADRWSGFATPKIAEGAVDGAGRVVIGEEATYDVFVDFEGAPYPSDEVTAVKYLLFDSNSLLVASGDAEFVAEGQYLVTLDAETTGNLESGSNLLEVVITVLPVASPTIVDFEFVSE
jgi:peptide/nickel transport system substrate-binding protein